MPPSSSGRTPRVVTHVVTEVRFLEGVQVGVRRFGTPLNYLNTGEQQAACLMKRVV